MNTLILNLGANVGTYAGVNDGIYVNYIGIGSDDISTHVAGTNGYDSKYDCIVYWLNTSPSSGYSNNDYTLNLYYNNNKGVVLGGFVDTTQNYYGANLQKTITSYPGSTIANYSPPTAYSQNSSNVILNGVSSVYPYYFGNTFSPMNGALSCGYIGGSIPLINYAEGTGGSG